MITAFTKLSETEKFQLLLEQKSLFFSGTKRKFSSEEEKESFYHAWNDPYLRHFPEFLLFYIEAGFLFGELRGCPDTTELSRTFPLRSYEKDFEKYFVEFPAHLHLNVKIGEQKKGIGRNLVEKFAGQLAEKHISGLHVLTTLQAGNAEFYFKLGFKLIAKKTYDNAQILFLGRA